MNKQKILFWTPRILAIAFILFLTMFSLDVFGGSESIWQQIGGFFVHSIPSFVLLAILLISWKSSRGYVAGFIFTGAGIYWLIVSRSFVSTWPISLPAIVVGLLFLWDWKSR